MNYFNYQKPGFLYNPPADRYILVPFPFPFPFPSVRSMTGGDRELAPAPAPGTDDAV